MPDKEKVIKGIERCLVCETSAIATAEGQKAYRECEYTLGMYCRRDKLLHDVLALLKDQEPYKSEETHLNRDEYCRVGDVLDCFDGMNMKADEVFHAVCLIEWAMGKRSVPLIQLQKEQGTVEQKWTSIKERYPEKEGFYLVSADHGNYHPWIAEMRIFNGIKGFCNGAVMPCIGAWMPLPEPFNEGR